MGSRFLVGVILLASVALSLTKTPAVKKFSRNELKEKNVEASLAIQEEANMLEKNKAELQEVLLMEARDIVYQTPGSLLVAGDVSQLEEACKEKIALQNDLRETNNKLKEHTKKARRRLVGAEKENKKKSVQ